ncbi:hypothetical protein B0H63DRAFT_457923 [Podospora didyma]|uniref:Uncharacterized protein n=1 Tax=Podospora didyma TaxID=330526 RepID=A0AAE0P4R0_9PEZI|nr:hypothetical protein B0H63DRAFT_457923 [Podospora didyma]
MRPQSPSVALLAGCLLQQAILAVAQIAPQTTAFPTTMFYPGAAHPSSMGASILAVNDDPKRAGNKVLTYAVQCLSDNFAGGCPSFPSGQLYHTQGSVWGGTIATGAALRTTTTFVCSLGGNPGKWGMSADCTYTIGAGVTTTKLASCEAQSAFIPLVVTGGGEKLPPSETAGRSRVGVEFFTSMIDDGLWTMGCDTPSRSKSSSSSSTTRTTTTSRPTAGLTAVSSTTTTAATTAGPAAAGGTQPTGAVLDSDSAGGGPAKTTGKKKNGSKGIKAARSTVVWAFGVMCLGMGLLVV